MRIKSYFAKTITEAMERARMELGSDAVIIASNRTSGATERLGVYEVVFGIQEADKTPKPAPALAPPPVETQEGLERLRNRMEDLRKSVSKKRAQASQARLPFAARASAVLTQTGFPSQVAEELLSGLQGRDKQDVVSAVRNALNSKLRTAPRLGSSPRGRCIVAVAGPPGSGKTTTLVKLAVKYGLLSKRPTRFISTDTYRLGGSDLLRRYAEAMDLRLDTPKNNDALERALGTADSGALVLIDTEALGAGASERSTSLASFLSGRADVEVHLTLPAYASFNDLSTMASRFKSFLPSKMILTGVDACSNIGPALAHSIATETAVSFLGTGREIPEDLEEASPEALTARLLPSLTAAAAAAA